MHFRSCMHACGRLIDIMKENYNHYQRDERNGEREGKGERGDERGDEMEKGIKMHRSI